MCLKTCGIRSISIVTSKADLNGSVFCFFELNKDKILDVPTIDKKDFC